MKKLFLFLILAGIFAGTNAQQFIQLTYKVQTYRYISADTVYTDESDLIANMTLICPTGSTDSIWFKGSEGTLDGKASGYIAIPPGDSRSLGYNDLIRLDSLTVIVKDDADIIVTPIKR